MGLVYGLGHALYVIGVFHDPRHSAPGFAALGAVALGVLVGIIALLVLAAVLSRLMLRGSGVTGFVGGWLLLVFVGGVAWIGAFMVMII